MSLHAKDPFWVDNGVIVGGVASQVSALTQLVVKSEESTVRIINATKTLLFGMHTCSLLLEFTACTSKHHNMYARF